VDGDSRHSPAAERVNTYMASPASDPRRTGHAARSRS